MENSSLSLGRWLSDKWITVCQFIVCNRFYPQEFPHTDDQCYLAHCFPYSLSKLLRYLNQLQLSPATSPHIQREELCKTLAGNSCPLLTITDFQGNIVLLWILTEPLLYISSRFINNVKSCWYHGDCSGSSWWNKQQLDDARPYWLAHLRCYSCQGEVSHWMFQPLCIKYQYLVIAEPTKSLCV